MVVEWTVGDQIQDSAYDCDRGRPVWGSTNANGMFLFVLDPAICLTGSTPKGGTSESSLPFQATRQPQAFDSLHAPYPPHTI